LTNGPSFIKMW